MQARGDDEDIEEPLPLEGLEKTVVMQSCKEFSAVSLNVGSCVETLVKVIYLINTGHVFSATEATDVFFGATKLFQNEDPRLRRLLYVALKELAVYGEQVFIASSSLVKDISSTSDFYRSNSLRVLRKVTDSTMIGPMERYLRQCVVDKSTNVVSAALVTGIHLAHSQPEMVKRWGTEVSEALKNRGTKAQYHALALLHKLRKSDRMSVMKLVQQAQAGAFRSPLALCLLIKHATELMQEDFAQSADLYKFVASMTHHTSDIVVFEAAKSICSLRNLTAKELTPAIVILQLYLTSLRPVMRFAAIRLLSRVASTYPQSVTPCNIDIEAMVSDPNRNIATMAITTLLKTGSEFNIDRLLKQIQSFLHDLSDEFRIVVVDSLRIMCAKFPAKYPLLLSFLTQALHDEGGAEFKRTIVETIITIVQENPEAKESALFALCEYIEDCEFSQLVQRVLYVLSEQAHLTSAPRKYIRFIFNRISLELPIVRASAVTTLAKMGAHCAEIRPRIVALLKRVATDADDDVRDRAVLFHKILAQGDEFLIRSFIIDVAQHVQKERQHISLVAGSAVADTVAPVSAAIEASAAKAAQAAATSVATSSGSAVSAQSSAVQLDLRDKMRKIPQLRTFGEPLRTTEITMLTEPDNEYVVGVAKHIFHDRVVLQFRIQNTMDDKKLCGVVVRTDTSELEVEPEFAIPADSIAPSSTAYSYVVLRINERGFPSGTVHCGFVFYLSEDGVDGDPKDSDEYPIDDFSLNVSDFISPVDVGDFDRQFDSMAGGGERVDTYALSTIKNLTAAAKQLVDFFGMHVVGGAPDKIVTKSHVVKMSGVLALADPTLILVSAKVFIAADTSIALTLSIRGGDDELREFLSQALVS